MSSSAIPRPASVTAKYTLNASPTACAAASFWSDFKRLKPLFAAQAPHLVVAGVGLCLSATALIVAPLLIAHAVDACIRRGNLRALFVFSALILIVYLIGSVGGYIQIRSMGSVAQRLLFSLRNQLFLKLNELPLAFFNQNRAGDLVSRINNDTEKLNQFVAQALMQSIGDLIYVGAAALFILFLNFRLAIAALLPALGALIITRVSSLWLRRKNLESLQMLGNMTAELQQGLSNFKAIAAFNRYDYFLKTSSSAIHQHFSASVKAGLADALVAPAYNLAPTLAQLFVLCYGLYLTSHGEATIGILVGFLFYVSSFYNPFRQLAGIWSTFQLAIAALDRLSEVLAMQSDMPLKAPGPVQCDSVIAFRNVHFHYPNGRQVLTGVNLDLLRGKTYALVGPTGGGKTTTALLMMRLYDPTCGTVLLDGRDIRSYDAEERARKIGFILQEPFLFAGTVRDNIVFGNAELSSVSKERLETELGKANLSTLISRFPDALDTRITPGASSISAGQRQIIAFIRAILRKPEILILDEPTANLDAGAEQVLQDILAGLPAQTVKVIIAHRLNTISNVDQIFFVNSTGITHAGSMAQALDMLLSGKRLS